MSSEDVSAKIKEIEGAFSKAKTSSGNKVENIAPVFKDILAVWRADPSNEEQKEEMYKATMKIVEYCFEEKCQSVVNTLSPEDLIELNKFFFATYQRISEKKNVGTLKPSKLFPLHQELLKNGGVGLMHRSMFSIKRTKKEKEE